MYISAKKPSTFYSSDPNIMILDDQGNPFYWHTNKQRSITFNLPVGEYTTDNRIALLPKFEPYGNKKYPIFRNTTFLRDLKLFRRENPNKASISLEHRIIIVDPKFYDSPYKPLKTFTLCHEVFHYFFHAKNKREKKNRHIHQHIEKQCDEAAAHFMLANGWNPTQVSLAVKMLLQGEERKECIREKTTHKKNNFRR